MKLTGKPTGRGAAGLAKGTRSSRSQGTTKFNVHSPLPTQDTGLTGTMTSHTKPKVRGTVTVRPKSIGRRPKGL